MNVPSLKILDTIGFDAAIDRAALLLGIDDPDVKRRTLPRVYPMGLGIISIAPVQMARAFAVFANQGRAVTPLAIRSIENRNGTVIIDNEREIRLRQRQKSASAQVISPQNAFVMTGLLKKTVERGGLGGQAGKFVFVDDNGERYRIAAGGKTGTTQNWSDAWTVGSTPYYTTAVWFGFDKPGNSLGLSLTGATLAGPVWGDFMREIHRGLPARDFARPESGVVDVTVCAVSGQLMTEACDSGSVTLSFLSEHRPTEYCAYHAETGYRTNIAAIEALRSVAANIDGSDLLSGLAMPTLDISALPVIPRPVVETEGTSAEDSEADGSEEDADGEEDSDIDGDESEDTGEAGAGAGDAPIPFNPFME
jgi:penicillin-binding protein 1A